MRMRALLVASVACGALLLAALGASGSAPRHPVPCSQKEVRQLVKRFRAAFNAGDRRTLDELIATEPRFEWWSTDARGERLHRAAADRGGLTAYFAARHRKGELLRLVHISVFVNSHGLDPHANFSVRLMRSAADLPSTLTIAKGGAYCHPDRPDEIFVWSMARERGWLGPPATGGTVRPNPAKPGDVVWVVVRVPYLIDNNGDGYRLSVSGPGGTDCASTASYGGGATWNPRYNHRHREAPDAFAMGPSRGQERTPNTPPTTWCVGHYEGRLVFEDIPRRGGKITERPVKRIAFDVR